MNYNYIVLSLFGISVFCLATTVAYEAIVGGNIAMSIKAVRYQVLIFIADRAPNCGGGIISKNSILTAAHCVINEHGNLISNPTSILAGTSDMKVAGLVIGVEKIFFPKEYNPRDPYPTGDIAVLRLKNYLDLDTYDMQIIKYPRYRELSFYEKKSVRIAGFGWDEVYQKNELIGYHSDDRLRFAEAEVRSFLECKNDHPYLNITDRYLCARIKQHANIRSGVCIGDEGGPLVHRGNTVIGILSVTVPGCSEHNTSAIYTRVSHYMHLFHLLRSDVILPDLNVINL